VADSVVQFPEGTKTTAEEYVKNDNGDRHNGQFRKRGAGSAKAELMGSEKGKRGCFSLPTVALS